MELYSVKQIANLVGISTQAVYKKLNSPEYVEYIVMSNGVKLLNETGLNMLLKSKDVSKNKQDANQVANNAIELQTELNAFKYEYITVLTEQIEYLKQQIETMSLQHKEQVANLIEQLRQKDQLLATQAKLIENEQVISRDKVFLLAENNKARNSFFSFWKRN